MNGLSARMARWRRRLGGPGAAGLCCAVYAAALYPLAVAPARDELARLEQRVAARERAAAARTDAAAMRPEALLARFYEFFPAADTAPAWLEKIYAAAGRQSLTLETGAYRFAAAAEGGRLARYEITLPVKGSYPQVRKLIGEVLAEIPAATLDDVRIARDSVGDGAVTAKLKFSLYLRGE